MKRALLATAMLCVAQAQSPAAPASQADPAASGWVQTQIGNDTAWCKPTGEPFPYVAICVGRVPMGSIAATGKEYAPTSVTDPGWRLVTQTYGGAVHVTEWVDEAHCTAALRREPTTDDEKRGAALLAKRHEPMPKCTDDPNSCSALTIMQIGPLAAYRTTQDIADAACFSPAEWDAAKP